MRLRIRKGNHYPNWFNLPFALPIRIKPRRSYVREFHIMFTDSCMFNLHDEDQWDVNKLFGFSIGHHQNQSSFRFGWRPILSEKKIEIVAYEYHDGFRIKTMPITKVGLNEWHHYSLSYHQELKQSNYIVDREIIFENNFYLTKSFGWGYTLGVYFGGNETAPHNIIIYRKRK